jgi:hypothetical protein
MRGGVLAVLGLALTLAACGGGRSATTHSTPAPATQPATATALPRGSHLLLDADEPLSWAYAAGGSLYYAYSNPVGEHVGEDYELTRVTTSTGRVAAKRRFDTALDDTLLAHGSLWVTTTDGNGTSLWRLDPRSLRIQAEQPLPSSRYTEGIAGSLAVAGGHLWIGNGVIDRVSLQTGKVERVVQPRHRGPVQLASDPTGRVLLASLGYEHPTYLARLNPQTGAPLTELTVGKSDSQPTLGGVVAGGAWIENSVGYRTTAWRVDLSTLKPTKTSAWETPAKRISVRTLDGVLWVTEPQGEQNLNYCANPVNGQPLARLPLLPGDSVLLTADRANYFYTDVPVNSHSVKLETAPISRRCV